MITMLITTTINSMITTQPNINLTATTTTVSTIMRATQLETCFTVSLRTRANINTSKLINSTPTYTTQLNIKLILLISTNISLSLSNFNLKLFMLSIKIKLLYIYFFISYFCIFNVILLYCKLVLLSHLNNLKLIHARVTSLFILFFNDDKFIKK